jgi:hypothetical protein
VEAIFAQFDSLEIIAGVPAANEHSLSDEPVFRFQGKDGYAAVMDLVRDDALAHPAEQRCAWCNPVGFTVDDARLTLLETKYVGRPVTVTANCTAVSGVGTPGVPAAVRDITVHRFDHSVPEIIMHSNEAHLLVDVSKITVPSDAILHELRVRFPRETTVTRYELIGRRSLSTRASKIRLEVATTT